MVHNMRLKQAREEKLWTVAHASEVVGVHVSTYNNWELGRHYPHITTLELLCKAFGASPAALGFAEPPDPEIPVPITQLQSPIPSIAFAVDIPQAGGSMLYDTLEVRVISILLMRRFRCGEYEALQTIIQQEIGRFDVMQPPQPDKETQLSRRQALSVIAKLPIGLFGLTSLGSVQPTAAEEILPMCASGLVACRALFNSGEVEIVSTTLATYLPTLANLARHSSRHQKQAANLAAQACLLITFLADREQDYDGMERYCVEAQQYARVAEDVNLEAAALLRLAVKFDYQSRWRKTLQTYQLVTPFVPQISPLLQAKFYLGIAGAYGYCNEKENARKMLAMGQNLFPAQPEKDKYYLAALTSKNTVALWTGLVQKYTNQYNEAVHTFSGVGQLQPQANLPEYNRIEFVNYAASVAIRQRDLEKSCIYLENAGNTALKIGHEQRYAETCDTYKQMRLVWENEPKVLALQELFSRR